MNATVKSFLLGCLLAFPLVATGQDDPFGDSTKASSDPFDDSVEAASDDPFAEDGTEANQDPFAEAKPKSKKRKSSGGLRIGSGLSGTIRGTIGGSSGGGSSSSTISSTNPASESVTMVNRSAVNEKIQQALDRKISQRFEDTPLVEAIRTMSDDLGIRIMIAGPRLEEIGLSTEEPITIELENVSLRSFLRLTLQPLGLTYAVQDEVLLVTSTEAAQSNPDLRFYRLDGELAEDCDELVNVIQQTVQPTAWVAAGGTASMATLQDRVIVVSAHQALHEHVQDFLAAAGDALSGE